MAILLTTFWLVPAILASILAFRKTLRIKLRRAQSCGRDMWHGEYYTTKPGRK